MKNQKAAGKANKTRRAITKIMQIYNHNRRRLLADVSVDRDIDVNAMLSIRRTMEARNNSINKTRYISPGEGLDKERAPGTPVTHWLGALGALYAATQTQYRLPKLFYMWFLLILMSLLLLR